MLKINELSRIYLGIQGENLEQTIRIDVSPWLIDYPNGTISIWHKRNGDEVPSATGATLDRDAGVLSWSPTNTDTYVSGEGLAEIRLTDGSVIKKSRAVVTGVSPSVTGAGEPLGSGWQDYIDIVEGYKDDAAKWATGGTTGTPGATNNAKYFSEQAAAAQEAAETAQGKAEDAQEAAETAQGKAEDAQEAAETAQGKAEDAKEAAETAQGKAEDAQTAAETAQGKAEDAQEAAETAQGKAEDAQEAAETAQGKAEDAQEAAETAQAAAEEWATGGSSGTPSATNNAKYYAEQAAASAEDAAEAATAAVEAMIDDTAGAGDTDKLWSADKVTSELQKKADLIEVTDTNAEAVKTIPDGANGMTMELLIGIEPVQDLHGYVYPWVGGANKNIFNEDGTDTDNGYVSGKYLDANGDLQTPSTPEWFVSEYTPVSGSTEYTLSRVKNANIVYICEYDSSKQFISGASHQISTNPVTFTTNANAKYVRIPILPYETRGKAQLEVGSQATDYVPFENICPISGSTEANVRRTNKNLIPTGTDTSKGYVNNKILKYDNGLQNVDGYFISEYFMVKPNQKYTYSMASSVYAPAVCFYNKNKNYINGYLFDNHDSIVVTSPANAYYARVTAQKATVGYTWFEFGEAKTAYESPSNVEITIPFLDGSTPLTVYGGTLTINKDGSGTLSITHVTKSYDGVTSGYKMSATGSGGTYASRNFYETLGSSYSDYGATSTGWLSAETLEKEKFVCNYASYKVSDAGLRCGIYIGNAGVQPRLIIKNEYAGINDLASCNAYLKQLYDNGTPLTFVLKKKNAQTYTLTAPQVLSLLGVNNLYADCGDILSVTYPADTKLYVDQGNNEKDAEITATKGIIADGMGATASRAIIKGELFIMNNTLYRATTYIANGATITPNTNCVATSIADEIGEYSETTLASGIVHYQYGRCHRLFIGGYVEFPNLVFVYPTVAEVESAIQTLGISWEVMYQHITINHKYVGYVGQAITSSDAFQIVYLDGTTESLPSSSATVTGNLIWFE